MQRSGQIVILIALIALQRTKIDAIILADVLRQVLIVASCKHDVNIALFEAVKSLRRRYSSPPASYKRLRARWFAAFCLRIAP